MKILKFLTLTTLFALTITSCTKEPTIEEQLVGNWELIEATVSGEINESFSNTTILFSGESNGSTLQMEILADQTTNLSGLLNITTTASANGLEIMSFDTNEDFNESRNWKVNAAGNLELIGTDDFGQGTLEDEQLIFTFDEILTDADEEFPFFSQDDTMAAELVFVKK